MLGLKVNNLAEAIGHSRKLEQTSLKVELDRLSKESKRLRLMNERHKAAFSIAQDKKHKNWWNTDELVRDYYQIDFENVLSKRLKERLKSEKRIQKLKQQQLDPSKLLQKTTKIHSFGINSKKKQQQPILNETDILLKKLHELKFPELKEKLIEQYQHKAQSVGILHAKRMPTKFKDSKLFMECAERFLSHRPYNIENHEKINVEENINRLKEKIYEKEKDTFKKCEERFDTIIKAFEHDKNEALGLSYGYYDSYDNSFY